MVSFKSLLLSKVNNFRGGQLEKHVRQQRKLTNDPNILSIISGDKIEFADAPRIQNKVRSPQFSDEETNLIKDKIDKQGCNQGNLQRKRNLWRNLKRKNLFLQFSYLIKVMMESD